MFFAGNTRLFRSRMFVIYTKSSFANAHFYTKSRQGQTDSTKLYSITQNCIEVNFATYTRCS